MQAPFVPYVKTAERLNCRRKRLRGVDSSARRELLDPWPPRVRYLYESRYCDPRGAAMPQQTRKPPYDLEGGSTFTWGAPFPASANAFSSLVTGDFDVYVTTDVQNAGGGYAWASLGVREIGPPPHTGNLEVAVDLSYEYHYLLEVHRAYAFAYGGLSLMIESVPSGEKEVSPTVTVFDENAWWSSQDVTKPDKKTLTLNMFVDPQHTYTASVFATVVAQGRGIQRSKTFLGTPWILGSRADANIKGTVDEFRLNF